MKRAVLSLFAAILAAPPAPAAGVPGWLAEAALRPTPEGAGNATCLHDEQGVLVPPKGRTAVTRRWAVRILSRSGTRQAVALAGYVRGQGEVRELEAWTLAPGGRVLRHWNHKDAADVLDAGPGMLYSEFRHLRLADPEIQPGQTFAFESVVESAPLFAQWSWRFRLGIACALSRFRLELPPGLDVLTHSAHMDSATVRRDGTAWSWEMRDQPALPSEVLAPARGDLGPFLHVQAVSAAGTRSPAGIAFRDWPSAARWLAELTAEQPGSSPEIAAMAAAATDLSRDTLERVRHLARAVQNLNYVSRDVNIGGGWGYRPHEAAEVARAGYGDCKDKANLLCALLRAAGLQAWMLLVNAHDRDGVDTAWASPGQFNHCITAIRAPAAYRGPLLDEGRRGRLMAFDPTDPFTAFGDLPDAQQGSWGLLVRREDGDLVRLPVLPEEASRLERRVDAEIDAAGRLSGRLLERSTGQAARHERATRRSGTDADYRRTLEAWLPAQGGSVDLRSWESADDSIGGRFELRLEYESPSFARPVAGRMLTYRGALISPRRARFTSDTTRTLPIALTSECVVETLSVRFPAGYAVDEPPGDIHVANDLGRLDATWSEVKDALVLTRRWQLRTVTVGPERWPDVRALYAARRASDEAMVVLVRR